MQPKESHLVPDAFLEAARAQALLSGEDAQTLNNFAKSNAIGSSEAALQTGMLKPIEVEIAQAFTTPNDLAVGYELKDVLGYGALGIVYRAYQSRLHRDVAIKSIIESRVTLQNVVARFEQEVTAIGRLKHPNIVRAYDSGCNRDRLYLVMELVEGQDLRKKLDEGRLDSVTSLWILRQTALGLAHAKSHDIIHRDVKPGNIILTEAPAGFDLPPDIPLVKIADFGLAQLNFTDEKEIDRTHLTVAGASMGTPMYSAPEQLAGDPIDHRADIYALGATLFHMLTGATPFESSRITKIIAAKARGEPPRMEMLPKRLDPMILDLMLDLMQHDPDKRLATYQELIDRIDETLQQITNPARGMGSSRRNHRTNRATRVGQPSGVREWLVTNANKIRLVAVGILAATLITIAIIEPSFLQIPASPTLVPDGWEQALFDGKTLSGFQRSEGTWKTTNDAEGGSVLTGTGYIIRPLPIPPAENQQDSFGWGCRVGIDLNSAQECEVHFGFSSPSFENCERYVVRYTPESVAFGKRTGMDGNFSTLTSRPSLVPSGGDAPYYAEIRVELHNAQWFVFYNDKLLGDMALEQPLENTALGLVSRQGDGNFEAPSIFRLIQPKIGSE
ncbi:serine/threonine protein kinase [Rubripirellula sp.]|nr:serine/threonine-protein kinase [Rubripirellula sp.]MDB4749506.1 serine/threonine protein kinase [Rubripirellula sp.]